MRSSPARKRREGILSRLSLSLSSLNKLRFSKPGKLQLGSFQELADEIVEPQLVPRKVMKKGKEDGGLTYLDDLTGKAK